MITPSRTATAHEQAQAATALVNAVIDQGVASTDDAHQRYELPTTVDQRAWGTVTMRLVADGVLARMGDIHTQRAIAHGRRIGTYYAPDTDRAREYVTKQSAALRTRSVQMTLFDSNGSDV